MIQVAKSFVPNYSLSIAPFTTGTSRRVYSPSLSSSKGDYNLEELMMAAKDPVTFEAYVLQKNKPKEKEPEDAPPKAKGKGYVPIEDWDKNRSKDDLSWEERVQFEGRRNGDQYKQNEILRHNLKSW